MSPVGTYQRRFPLHPSAKPNPSSARDEGESRGWPLFSAPWPEAAERPEHGRNPFTLSVPYLSVPYRYPTCARAKSWLPGDFKLNCLRGLDLGAAAGAPFP